MINLENFLLLKYSNYYKHYYIINNIDCEVRLEDMKKILKKKN